MIKKIALICLLATNTIIVAQERGREKECQEYIQKNFVDKVKKYSSKNLIPFYSEREQKWGYMDKVSKKRLTNTFMKSVRFFTPDFYTSQSDIRIFPSDLSCAGLIKGSKEKYNISKFTDSSYNEGEYVADVAMGSNRNYSHMVNADVSGFKVDADGNLIEFNPKYYNEKYRDTKIEHVFKLDGKYYALVDLRDSKEYHFSVIDERGEAIEGFEDITTYVAINIRYSTDTDVWFSIENENGDYDIKSLMTKEVIGSSKSKLNYSRNYMGYEIVSVGNKKGLLDVTTMKWKIVPSEKNDFEAIYFSSSQAVHQSYGNKRIIPIDEINENRKIVDIYILNKKNTFYDLDMKEYKPKD
ncbi:MAG: hypothetical protein LBI72_06230 [Flavobacteriaceae bacterium]|jgi:hypothetical protein|nr:hypothetical protein [Flavobacteriaceae bacterium]